MELLIASDSLSKPHNYVSFQYYKSISLLEHIRNPSSDAVQVRSRDDDALLIISLNNLYQRPVIAAKLRKRE
jgi:hypothetical protein